MIKLVLADMDGTLLPFGARTISQRTHRAIRAAREAGIAFGPASGRDYINLLEPFGGDASCLASGIMSNGKKVFAHGELVLRKTFSRASLERLEQLVRPCEGSSLWLVADTDGTGTACQRVVCGIEPGDELAMRAVRESGRAMTPEPCVPELDVTTAGIYVNADHTPLEQFRKQCQLACPELDFPAPAPFYLDVLPRGWSKAEALDALMDSLGVTLDEVAFVGDSENDLTLLEKVPNSYAVANATPEAKAAARFSLPDAADDAVAQLLERLVAERS